jgi:hypothetical protein
MARFAGLHHLLLGIVCALWLASPAAAQTGATQRDDDSRAVRIIEDPPASTAPAVPAPALQPPAPLAAPVAPTPPEPGQAALSPVAPSLPGPAEPVLTPTPAPSPEPGQAALSPAPAPRPDPGQAVLGPVPDLGAMQASLKGRNSAGVVVEILPRTELQVGEKIALRVATRKQGYLVLVDVDSSGKLTQIYPNRRSLMTAQDGQETANLIKPGRPITIPQVGNPFAGFEFVAAPPTGVAMVVAILSDRPVQMLDLPDIPPGIVGQGAAINYLTDWTRNLRIARTDASGRLEEADWSFDAKIYVIR